MAMAETADHEPSSTFSTLSRFNFLSQIAVNAWEIKSGKDMRACGPKRRDRTRNEDYPSPMQLRSQPFRIHMGVCRMSTKSRNETDMAWSDPTSKASGGEARFQLGQAFYG